MGLRINHNLASLGASLNLGRANEALSSSLAKLSTGLKINTAADGPADLIISEKFRSQINSISAAVENTQNAISMLSTAEGALNEVNSLLNKMQGLALKAAQTGTQSPDEIAASQAEIDAALESINSISRNTSFGSVNLLDGSQSIETTGVDTSNLLVDIDKANFAGDSKAINVNVVTAATRATATIDLTAAGQKDDSGTDGILSKSQVIKVTGNRGSTTITFAAGSSASSITEEINSQVTQTGVIATVKDNVVSLQSAKYGATEFVTVEDVDGDNDLLDINAGGANSSSAATVKAIDLTKGGLGQGFRLGGTEVRTYGQAGSKYADYKVTVNVTSTVTTSVFVNDAAKNIAINVRSGASVNSVAAALSSKLTVSFGAVVSGTKLLTAQDTASLIMDDVTSNLQVLVKKDTYADKHSLAPKLSIGYAGAAAATYSSTTNTIGLTVQSAVAYTDNQIQSVVDAAGTTLGAALNGFFEFKVVNGGGYIGRTTTNSGVSASETSSSTAAKSVNLSSHPGTGQAFKVGTTFGVKLTSTGAAKYQDYTVTYSATTGATEAVDINDSAKTITIIANAGTSTGTSLVNALNTAAGGGTQFAVTANITAASAVPEASGSSKFTPSGAGLLVSAKGDTASMKTPRISILEGGNEAITYDSVNEIIGLTINADTDVITTQAQFDSVLNNSAAAAKLKGLFDFTVTGAIDATTIEAIELTPGGVALGVGGAGTKTNYIKATGADGSLEVNGVKTAANNLRYTFDNGNIRGHITLDEQFNVAGKSSSFTISGKGAFLQMGSKTQLSHQTGVGIQSVAANQLATGLYLDTSFDPTSNSIDNANLYTTATLADITSGGDFDLAKDAQTAYDIISQAITEVSVARSKLGALISNTLESNINSLGVAFENLTASESRIRDVDFAAETAEFTRAQILVQAGTSVAAQANVATQAALQLLG